MNLKMQFSPQRHITGDLAGAFASLSRMASSSIRDTEKGKIFLRFSSVSLCLCGGVFK